MFLGMQNNLIAYTADSKEELENLTNINFSEIIETDLNYILVNGKYITEETALKQAKNNKHAENLAKAKQAVENGYVTFKDALFETNAQTVGDLTATMLMLQAVSEQSAEGEVSSASTTGTFIGEDAKKNISQYNWLSKDDKVVELTLEDFTTLGLLIANYKNDVWNNKYIDFKNAIENAQSFDEVEKINLNYE